MLDILCITGVVALFALLGVVARAVEKMDAPTGSDEAAPARARGRS